MRYNAAVCAALNEERRGKLRVLRARLAAAGGGALDRDGRDGRGGERARDGVDRGQRRARHGRVAAHKGDGLADLHGDLGEFGGRHGAARRVLERGRVLRAQRRGLRLALGRVRVRRRDRRDEPLAQRREALTRGRWASFRRRSAAQRLRRERSAPWAAAGAPPPGPPPRGVSTEELTTAVYKQNWGSHKPGILLG
mgnify:CR=1 FL=1